MGKYCKYCKIKQVIFVVLLVTITDLIVCSNALLLPVTPHGFLSSHSDEYMEYLSVHCVHMIQPASGYRNQ